MFVQVALMAKFPSEAERCWAKESGDHRCGWSLNSPRTAVRDWHLPFVHASVPQSLELRPIGIVRNCRFGLPGIGGGWWDGFNKSTCNGRWTRPDLPKAASSNNSIG